MQDVSGAGTQESQGGSCASKVTALKVVVGLLTVSADAWLIG